MTKNEAGRAQHRGYQNRRHRKAEGSRSGLVITLTVPPQEVITRDNVTIRVTAVLYFYVVDPIAAVVNSVPLTCCSARRCFQKKLSRYCFRTISVMTSGSDFCPTRSRHVTCCPRRRVKERCLGTRPKLLTTKAFARADLE